MDSQMKDTNHALLMGDRDRVQVKLGDRQGIMAAIWLHAQTCRDQAKEPL